MTFAIGFATCTQCGTTILLTNTEQPQVCADCSGEESS